MLFAILIMILVLIVYTIVWALPLYVGINLVLWLFNMTFRVTILQAIGIGFLISVIQCYFDAKGVR